MIRVQKTKTRLFISMWEQWKKWSFLEKVSLVSSIAGFIGLIQAFYPSSPSKPEERLKAYDLSQSRHKAFLELLQTAQASPRDTLRIGCVPWSEASCLAAGNFLQLFSEAGWKIDENRMYKMEPDIPVDGMTIATQGNAVGNLEPLPPHLGRWSSMNESQLVILIAFKYMDNTVHSSRDPSLPPQTLGIYFGPEPFLTETIKPRQKISRKPLINFYSKAAAVEQICTTNKNDYCKNMVSSWEKDIELHLKRYRFESTVISEWKDLSKNVEKIPVFGIEKQKNFLASLILGLR